MTEREYIRLHERIFGMWKDSMPFPRSDLPQAQFERIWSLLAAGETQAKSLSELMAAATRAKRRLLNYVEEEGPFVFEEGRCLFIDVYAFEFDDWRLMRIPARDVTHLAQAAFLTECERDPKSYFYNHRYEFTFLGIVAILVLLYLLL